MRRIVAELRPMLDRMTARSVRQLDRWAIEDEQGDRHGGGDRAGHPLGA